MGSLGADRSVQVCSGCALMFCIRLQLFVFRLPACVIVRNVSRGPEQSEALTHRTFGLPPSVCGCSVGGQLEPYYLDHPSLSPTAMSSHHHSSSPNLVGGHYRVGRKIGEGSFGVIFEGLPSSRFSHPSPSLSPV